MPHNTPDDNAARPAHHCRAYHVPVPPRETPPPSPYHAPARQNYACRSDGPVRLGSTRSTRIAHPPRKTRHSRPPLEPPARQELRCRTALLASRSATSSCRLSTSRPRWISATSMRFPFHCARPVTRNANPQETAGQISRGACADHCPPRSDQPEPAHGQGPRFHLHCLWRDP